MKILITTVGKNTDRLKAFIECQYDDIYILLSANEKSSGVTWFTLTSVHCADNKTATRSV